MATKSRVMLESDPEVYEWQKREGAAASVALTELLNEQTGRQRRAYAQAWEQHEVLAETLMSSSPDIRRAVESLGRVMIADGHTDRLVAVDRGQAVLDQQMDIMNGTLAERLSFRSAPYDLTWTDFQPSGASGTAAHGPSANLGGSMSLDVTETYVDRPVAYGGWMSNAAGVGSWFKPKAQSVYVRVAPYCVYNYRWKDDSSLQVAHNRGDVAVLVQRFVGPGRFETVLDTRTALWRDGTSWYQTHQDEQSGTFVDSNYFFASSDNWYVVWVWFSSGIDFATKTTFGSSRAFNSLAAGLKWLVFEQWG